jgi:tetratricopeptide (TPR) repeat protein
MGSDFLRFFLDSDYRRTIEDYNQVIRANLNDAIAYNNRDFDRNELGDKKATIADLQKAADLFQQQGSTRNYQKAMKLLEKLK